MGNFGKNIVSQRDQQLNTISVQGCGKLSRPRDHRRRALDARFRQPV